jgi:hypothetical protein
VFVQAASEQNFGKKLGTYLRRSVFYVYGMGEDVANSVGMLEQTKKFWTNALQSMNGSIGGLGTDLNVQNAVPVIEHAYAINLRRDGQDLDGRMSLLVDADGNLVDSWLQVTRLSIVGLTGTLRCEGGMESPNCRLTAKTTAGLVTQSAEEDVGLSASEGGGMNGQIGVKSALMYPITATRAEN